MKKIAKHSTVVRHMLLLLSTAANATVTATSAVTTAL